MSTFLPPALSPCRLQSACSSRLELLSIVAAVGQTVPERLGAATADAAADADDDDGGDCDDI